MVHLLAWCIVLLHRWVLLIYWTGDVVAAAAAWMANKNRDNKRKNEWRKPTCIFSPFYIPCRVVVLLRTGTHSHTVWLCQCRCYEIASFYSIASLFFFCLINVSAHWFRNYIFEGWLRILIWTLYQIPFSSKIHFVDVFFFSKSLFFLIALIDGFWSFDLFQKMHISFLRFIVCIRIYFIKSFVFNKSIVDSTVSHRSVVFLADVFFLV